MLLFGHVGITGAIFKAYDILRSKDRPADDPAIGSGSKPSLIVRSKQLPLLGAIDYRLVWLGSLLPDIIDKPVWLLTADTASLSGHNFGHTLLFNIALFIGGLIFIKKPWLLLIALSSFTHLVFDKMWNGPVILLWPLLGPMPKEATADWLPNLVRALFSQPDVFISEVIGLVILLLFVYRLVRKQRVNSFIRSGVI